MAAVPALLLLPLRSPNAGARDPGLRFPRAPGTGTVTGTGIVHALALRSPGTQGPFARTRPRGMPQPAPQAAHSPRQAGGDGGKSHAPMADAVARGMGQAPLADEEGPLEASAAQEQSAEPPVAQAAGFTGVHHVGLLCQDMQRSLEFYCSLLGMEVNPARPDHKLPYDGRWLWAGSGMIHLMVLPSPDPVSGRPEHGGHDRHACIQVQDVEPLKAALDRAGVPYTASQSGRPAVFCRDPDGNALEFAVFE